MVVGIRGGRGDEISQKNGEVIEVSRGRMGRECDGNSPRRVGRSGVDGGFGGLNFQNLNEKQLKRRHVQTCLLALFGVGFMQKNGALSIGSLRLLFCFQAGQLLKNVQFILGEIHAPPFTVPLQFQHVMGLAVDATVLIGG